jgi:hypothetical protein
MEYYEKGNELGKLSRFSKGDVERAVEEVQFLHIHLRYIKAITDEEKHEDK